jgi:protein-arginine kinase activator protein McsA
MGEWSKKEIEFLRNNLNYHDNSELSNILGRTRIAVKRKLYLLKLTRNVIVKQKKRCLNCTNEFESFESQNRKFCSQSCSASHTNKLRDSQVYVKQGQKMKGKVRQRKEIIQKCEICGETFTTVRKKRKTCSEKCCKILRSRTMSKIQSQMAQSLERRLFLRDIGRIKGGCGFGKKGMIEGIKYDSLFEMRCFKFLLDNKISFVPHKPVPNSSKISDVFLINHDIYVELDGLNREKRKEHRKKEYKNWLDKLRIYEEQKLNYMVFYNSQQFIDFINGAMV